MIGIRVTMPSACFRKGWARSLAETFELPPPSTAYGFLLSMVGEYSRMRHIGASIVPVMIHAQKASTVIRTVWRAKVSSCLPGNGKNKTIDYQQILTDIDVLIWADSSNETCPGPTLEDRLRIAMDPATRSKIRRSGPLYLGESTHLVNEINLFCGDASSYGRAFLLNDSGDCTLPIWVDHVGSAGTRYVTGSIEHTCLMPPPLDKMPRIEPV